MTQLKDTAFYAMFAGRIRGFPVQMLWAIGLLLLLMFLYNRSRFGARVHFVGDNRGRAAQGAQATGGRV